MDESETEFQPSSSKNEDEYAAWFSEAMTSEGDDIAEDYSDSIAELFGGESGDLNVNDEVIDVPVLEDYQTEEVASDVPAPESYDNPYGA